MREKDKWAEKKDSEPTDMTSVSLWWAWPRRRLEWFVASTEVRNKETCTSRNDFINLFAGKLSWCKVTCKGFHVFEKHLQNLTFSSLQLFHWNTGLICFKLFSTVAKNKFYYLHLVNEFLRNHAVQQMRKTHQTKSQILVLVWLVQKQYRTSQTGGYLNPIRPDTKQNGPGTVGSSAEERQCVSSSSTRARNNIFLTKTHSVTTIRPEAETQSF